MSIVIDPAFHLWFSILLTMGAFYFYSSERFSLEVSAMAILAVLLLFGQFFPLLDGKGGNLLDAGALLAGFANPALIAVLALLVIGQGMVQTSALAPVTGLFLNVRAERFSFVFAALLLFVVGLSAFMNNTPLVILCIPVLQALALRSGIHDSRTMMPLSFASIAGGMITLLGSSTNMLVSTTLAELGHGQLGFFSFTKPGLVLAAAAMFYILFIMPRLLPDRASMMGELQGGDKLFIAEIDIVPGSGLLGAECRDGQLKGLPDAVLRLVYRRGVLILPPFEGYKAEVGDVLIVAASRDTLLRTLSSHAGHMLSALEQNQQQQQQQPQPQHTPENAAAGQAAGGNTAVTLGEHEAHVLGEIMITPASRLIDRAIDHVDFMQKYQCLVLGIQRKAQIIRRRLGQIRLEAGDVLLVAGEQEAIRALRNDPDMILLSGTKREVPATKKAPMAAGIFVATVASAATGVLDVPVAAVTGATLMVVMGCLNIRQAMRAIDRKIFLLVGSALALALALKVTGGALFLADIVLSLSFARDPFYAIVFLFVLVSILTNILSNNACAVLFTPVAAGLAVEIGADPATFAIAVVLAANCSFASPIGYQTNLLVMGPGHYQFRDFIRAGTPLLVLMWVAFACVAKFLFGY